MHKEQSKQLKSNKMSIELNGETNCTSVDIKWVHISVEGQIFFLSHHFASYLIETLQEAQTGTLEIPGTLSPVLKMVASPFLALTALTPVGFLGAPIFGPPGAAGAGG